MIQPYKICILLQKDLPDPFNITAHCLNFYINNLHHWLVLGKNPNLVAKLLTKSLFMKKLLLFLALMIMGSSFLFSQANKVLGFWLTEKETSQVEIYKAEDGKYYGRISWLEELNEDGKPKMDKENPDEALKSRPILGLNLLEEFNYNQEDQEWVDGSIYDPDNGKTYDCYMWFEDDAKVLKIKGFVMGMRFLGRSTAWKRENDRNK